MNTWTTNLSNQAIPKDDVPAVTQPVIHTSVFHQTTHLDPEDEKTHNPNTESVTKISKIDGIGKLVSEVTKKLKTTLKTRKLALKIGHVRQDR